LKSGAFFFWRRNFFGGYCTSTFPPKGEDTANVIWRENVKIEKMSQMKMLNKKRGIRKVKGKIKVE
jgi:hypothetical protein